MNREAGRLLEPDFRTENPAISAVWAFYVRLTGPRHYGTNAQHVRPALYEWPTSLACASRHVVSLNVR